MTSQPCASLWTSEFVRCCLCVLCPAARPPQELGKTTPSRTHTGHALICSMIDEEMDEFEPEDYISSLPPIPPPSFPEDSVLAAEYQRVASNPASRLSAVDGTRYQVKPPRSVQELLARVAWCGRRSCCPAFSLHQPMIRVILIIAHAANASGWQSVPSAVLLVSYMVRILLCVGGTLRPCVCVCVLCGCCSLLCGATAARMRTRWRLGKTQS